MEGREGRFHLGLAGLARRIADAITPSETARAGGHLSAAPSRSPALPGNPSESERMNIHEYQAKDVLKGFGVPVATGIPAFSVDEAVAAAEKLGGPVWVVKAQIHAGGRGKAGGVKVVKSPRGGQAAFCPRHARARPW